MGQKARFELAAALFGRNVAAVSKFEIDLTVYLRLAGMCNTSAVSCLDCFTATESIALFAANRL